MWLFLPLSFSGLFIHSSPEQTKPQESMYKTTPNTVISDAYRPSQSLELLRLLFNPFIPRRCLFECTVQLLGITFIETYANIQTEEFSIQVNIQNWPRKLNTSELSAHVKVIYNILSHPKISTDGKTVETSAVASGLE